MYFHKSTCTFIKVHVLLIKVHVLLMYFLQKYMYFYKKYMYLYNKYMYFQKYMHFKNILFVLSSKSARTFLERTCVLGD